MNAEKQLAVTSAISIPKDVLQAAKAKAAAQGRSFSNYATQLIKSDLKKNGNSPTRQGNYQRRG